MGLHAAYTLHGYLGGKLAEIIIQSRITFSIRFYKVLPCDIVSLRKRIVVCCQDIFWARFQGPLIMCWVGIQT
jgi:hypothetical protein